MEKLDLIQSYIDSCNEAIISMDIEEAEELIYEIIGVFGNEIKGLVSRSYIVEKNNSNNIIIIRQMPTNYAADIRAEKEKMACEIELARLKQPYISAHAEANPNQTTIVTTNVTITIEQCISQINDISEKILSMDDKKTLQQYIYLLEGIKSTKDKNKYWDKTKELFRFIADKGIDVAIAVLPYIIKGLQSFRIE